MTETTLPGLVVPLEARIDKLERGLRRASVLQAQGATAMERRAAQSADRLRNTYGKAADGIAISMARVSGRLAGGLVAGLTAGAAAAVADNARQIVRGIAEIGDQAERAGVSAEAFQQWSYVARQNRIDVGALTDGLKELNLRADELIVTGAGPATEAFARLGFGAEDLKAKLEDPSELMLEIIDRAKRLDRAARIRVSDEIFGGTAGERFVELMDGGADAIRAQMSEAKELGLVMDDDMIRKAADLDAKFNQLTERMRGLWRAGVVGAAEFFGLIERERAKLEFDPDTAAKIVGPEMADQLADLPEVDQGALGVIEGMQIEYSLLAEEAQNLVAQLNLAAVAMRGMGNTDVAQAFTDLAARLSKASSAFEDTAITGEEFADRLRDIGEEADAAVGALDEIDRVRMGGVIGSISSLLDWIAKIPAAASEARKEVAELAGMDTGPFLEPGSDGYDLLPPGAYAPTTSPRPRGAPPLIDERGSSGTGGGGGRSGGGGGVARESKYAAETAAIREETRALELEAAALASVALAGGDLAQAVDLARMKAEALHAAMRDGTTVTPQMRAEIDAMVAGYGAAAAAADQARDRIESIQQAQDALRSTAESAFTGLVTGALTFREALGQVFNQLAQIAASRVFDQLVGGLFSGMFGGGGTGNIGTLFGFSAGGYTGSGGTFEPAGVVHRGEFVMSKRATDRIGAANLDALHQSALRGYAGGGFVTGSSTSPLARDLAAPGNRNIAPQIAINAPVTVHGSAGTPEQNSDLAKKMAREMEQAMRGVVVDEIRAAMRPGNMMNRR